MAFIIALDPENSGEFIIESTSTLVPDNLDHVKSAYLSACTNLEQYKDIILSDCPAAQPAFHTTGDSTRPDNIQPIFSMTSTTSYPNLPPSLCNNTRFSLPPVAEVYANKKYKPVAQKVRPVLGTLPEKFRIERHIDGDPLANMPKLSPNPPPFTPTGYY